LTRCPGMIRLFNIQQRGRAMSTKITIAQALRRIKKLKGQIAEHTQRAQQSVSYEQGKLPAFRFNEEVHALKSAQNEMVDLQARVSIANAKASIMDGTDELSHSEAIRRLQEMKGEIAFLRGLNLRNEVVKSREQDYDEAKNTYVMRVTETVWLSDLSELDRDKQVRQLQDHFEALNNVVEDHNHKVAV